MPGVLPEQVIATYLDAQIVSLVTGTNLFMGPPRSGLEASVFVVSAWGGKLFNTMGGTASREFVLQVIVQTPRNDYKVGSELANLIWETLHLWTPSETDYMSCKAKDGCPRYLGAPETNHLWSIEMKLLHHFDRGGA